MNPELPPPLVRLEPVRRPALTAAWHDARGLQNGGPDVYLISNRSGAGDSPGALWVTTNDLGQAVYKKARCAKIQSPSFWDFFWVAERGPGVSRDPFVKAWFAYSFFWRIGECCIFNRGWERFENLPGMPEWIAEKKSSEASRRKGAQEIADWLEKTAQDEEHIQILKKAEKILNLLETVYAVELKTQEAPGATNTLVQFLADNLADNPDLH